jgi:hypothetical protein
MKISKVKAQKENYRLRRKVEELESSLRACRNIIEIQAQSLELTDRGRRVIEAVIEEYF